MPMETLLTFVIMFGLPLWLVVEELVHRFSDKRARRPAAQPKAAAGPTTREHRRPLETSSHTA